MKTFEEKLTAWLDGRLTGAELAAFERELESHPEALAETPRDVEFANFLRTNLAPQPLANADFFNHQILQQIAPSQPATSSRRAPRISFWTLPRMAFSGFALLALATALYFAAVPKTWRDVKNQQDYVDIQLNHPLDDAASNTSNVFNARSDEPGITATAFHSKQDNANVLWLDGLNYMPGDQKLR